MITGVILARNEQDNIVDCIRMLRPHVGEIILINMESTDGTVEAARPHVDNVLFHPLTANFDAARNVAIDAARFNWLWFVDADERVPAATGNAVNDALRQRGEEFVALWIPFKSYFCGQWMQHCGWWPGYTMPRVLKRGHFRFANRLHGGVEFDGPEMRFPPDPKLSVEHFSYKSIEHYLEKFNRYTSVEAQNLAEDGQKLNWEVAVREMVRDLWLYYEKNEGHLDGRRGWILSWLAGQYRWFSRAKLLDVSQAETENSEPDVPPDIDAVLDVMSGELARLRGRKPLSSFGVVFRSPLFDLSGYADDGRVLLRALAGGQWQVAAEEIRWSDVSGGLPQSDHALFRALLRAKRTAQTIAITNCIPTLCKPDPNAVFNIIRTTFETDRIPGQWLPLLNEYQEVWVHAEHTMRAFRRAGVAPEKLRVVPGFRDTEIFNAEGDRMPLPEGAGGRSFVFLSVFDWQLRKGWDVLLKAFCQEFTIKDDVALLLKITRGHGHSNESIRTQIDEVLDGLGQNLNERPDIVLWEKELTAVEMASLYRGVDAFVLPTRGEGWGRPLMEAMACGLPTIGTAGSGNSDFMSEENSFLIPAKLVPVSDEAADEIAVYRGHKWLEPSLEGLRKAMRSVVSDASGRERISRRAVKSIESNFGTAQAALSVEQELQRVANQLQINEVPPPKGDQIRIELEGEFFASHSFSNINEQLALQFIQDRSIALSIRRVRNQPTHDDSAPSMHRIGPYVGRAWDEATQVTIRHAFPPNWSPAPGKWVHIQPWEFGALPLDWVEPVLENVDEIWVPSNYVKNVYLRSGIPEQRIQVIPWGVDPNVFAPDVPPLLLPCEGKFIFLFVGGTIARKGFDLLLNAYLTEFSHEDDICLVVKDLGASTFYRFGNARQQILQAIADPTAPHLVYLDEDMTPGQLASLYAVADCFVAPYRGEGFGLPILEAMASGVAPIVPRGGASDDFVDEDTAYLLPAEEVECEHAWRLCGIGTELAIETRDIREAMRKAFEQRDQTREMGKLASTRVRKQFTWERSARQMLARIKALAGGAQQEPQVKKEVTRKSEPRLTVCLLVKNNERTLPDCLSRVRPVADEVIVFDCESRDRSAAIAGEYQCRVYGYHWEGSFSLARNRMLRRSTGHWILTLEPHELVNDSEALKIKSLINALPKEVYGVRVQIENGGGRESEVRLLRNLNDVEFQFRACEDVYSSIARLGGQIADSDILIEGTREANDSQQSLVFSLLHADLAENPNHPTVLYNLGKTHFADGNFFHAECYLSDCIQSLKGLAHSAESSEQNVPAPLSAVPYLRDAWLKLIKCHRNTGSELWAVQVAEEAREQFPNDPQFLTPETWQLTTNN